MNKYTNLITSEYSNSTKFNALVELLTGIIESNTNLLNDTKAAYDVDTAINFQLDYIGQWVGLNRYLSTPILNTYFEWDNELLGWNHGYWQEQYSPSGIIKLPDNLYRQLIKAKIFANHWDGTIESAKLGFEKIFPNNKIIVTDNQDMTFTVSLLNPIDSITQALIDQGYMNNLKPAGVRLIFSTTAIFFGFDMSTATIDGYDIGSF